MWENFQPGGRGADHLQDREYLHQLTHLANHGRGQSMTSQVTHASSLWHARILELLYYGYLKRKHEVLGYYTLQIINNPPASCPILPKKLSEFYIRTISPSKTM